MNLIHHLENTKKSNGGFHSHGGTPKWMVYFMENPSINGWELGVALFWETTKWWWDVIWDLLEGSPKVTTIPLIEFPFYDTPKSLWQSCWCIPIISPLSILQTKSVDSWSKLFTFHPFIMVNDGRIMINSNHLWSIHMKIMANNAWYWLMVNNCQ